MSNMQDLVYIQSAMAHMAMAMRMLDNVGADISAAHINDAMESLRAEPVVRRTFMEIYKDTDLDFSMMDSLVDEMLMPKEFSKLEKLAVL